MQSPLVGTSKGGPLAEEPEIYMSLVKIHTVSCLSVKRKGVQSYVMWPKNKTPAIMLPQHPLHLWHEQINLPCWVSDYQGAHVFCTWCTFCTLVFALGCPFDNGILPVSNKQTKVHSVHARAWLRICMYRYADTECPHPHERGDWEEVRWQYGIVLIQY